MHFSSLYPIQGCEWDWEIPPGQVLGYYRVNIWTIVHAHIYIFSQFTVKSPNPLNCGKKLECLPKNRHWEDMQTP